MAAQDTFDRIIVFTDEQSSDTLSSTGTKVYIINIASTQHGVASAGRVERISGWSEAVFDYIQRSEEK